MASSSTILSVPSSSSTKRWKYDVFLSFRGEDTRKNFTAHLHTALSQKGINTFKDNLLPRGEKISPALLQAIEESRFSIIVLSENYASSSWCLEELTKILECVEEGGHTALPVFYNVDPSNVRKQEGSFAKAFAKHEQVYKDKMEQVVKWRDALTEAATIAGCDTRNRDFKFPSNNLRSLHWHGYPLKSLPSNFHPEKLVELNMCYSLLKQLWEGKKAFEKLKFIKLSHSQHLTKTPDFSAAPKLRRIILNGCTSLVKLHPSIGALKELIFLNLEGCSKLEKFPEVVQGNLEDLSGISLEGTAIRELPSSIGGLNRLVLLNLRNCKKLASLPQSICELISLQTLTLSGCSKLKKLPDDLGRLQCLVELHVDGTGIKEVPSSINLLTNLQELSLAGCKGWESKSWNLAFSFGSSPTLEPLRLPRLSGLYSLKILNLSDCNLLEGALPIDLSSLSSLEMLDLSRNSFITIPANLSGHSRLHVLMLPYCKSLQSLPELPSSIRYLNAEACTSLETFSCSPSACTSKRYGGLRLEFSNCFRLMENEHNDSVKHILLGIQLLASIPKFLQPFLGGFIDGPHNLYDAIVPGSRIPEWFVDQSTGSSVTVELPPHWYNTKLMGMAVCAVIGATGVIDPTIEEWRPQIYFKCSSVIYQGDDAIMSRSMKDDHTWFRYLSLCWLHGRTPPFGKSRGSMVVSFGSWEEKLEVKKCGVRLVYEGEEKDSHCSFPCGAMLPEEREETDSECSFPGEGDESDSGSEDLRQSNSDSESKELSRAPCRWNWY